MRPHFNDVMKQHKSLEDILGCQQADLKSESVETLTDYSDYLYFLLQIMGQNLNLKYIATYIRR